MTNKGFIKAWDLFFAHKDIVESHIKYSVSYENVMCLCTLFKEHIIRQININI